MRMSTRAGAAAAATAMLIGLGIVVASSPAHAATLLTDDFEDGNSTGWSTSGGAWSVQSDGSRVLRQATASANTRARIGTPTWTDYTVTARVKPTAYNGTMRTAGVLARVQGSGSGYYAIALSNRGTLELRRASGGSEILLDVAAYPVTLNSWYTLSLTVAGSTITGSVQGGPVLSVVDTLYPAGAVGLATAYASATFDDVRVDTVVAQPGPTTNPCGSTVAPAAVAHGMASVNDLGQAGTTGGAGGVTVTVTTVTELVNWMTRPEPVTIQVAGTIPLPRMQAIASNKTVVGVGTCGKIVGGGIIANNVQNVILRNLTFAGSKDDAIAIQGAAHHVWVDHNDLSLAFDGLVDIRLGATYVTVSWNHFFDHDKSSLLGADDANGGTDIGRLRVTYDHNLFDGTNQRHPRVRFGEPVHVLNNYYRNIGTYAIASTMNAGVLVEGNYFENVPETIHVGYAESAPGRVVERNNIYVNSGTPETVGTVTEPSTLYAYTVDPPATVPGLVLAGAGVGRI